MYYHNRSPQADEEDNDDEQQRREEEMDDATDRLADVMEACGAPRSEAVKAAKGKVRHAQ